MMVIRFPQCALFALICFALQSSVHAQFRIQNPLQGIGNKLGGSISNGITDSFKGAGQVITESIKVAPSAVIPGLQVPDRILEGRGYGLNPDFRMPSPGNFVPPSTGQPSPVMPYPNPVSPGYGGSGGGIIDQLPHNLGQVIQNPGKIMNPGTPIQGGGVQQPFQGQVQNPVNYAQPQQVYQTQGGVVTGQFQGQVQNSVNYSQPQQVIRSQPIRRVFRNAFRR